MNWRSQFEHALASVGAALLLCQGAAATDGATRPTGRITLFDGAKAIEEQNLYPWLKSLGRQDPDKVFRGDNGELHINDLDAAPVRAG